MARKNKSTTIKCAYCDYKTKQGKTFEKHLLIKHNITDPFNDYYLKHNHNNHHPKCNCGCGENLKWSGWTSGFTSKFLRGHNAKNDSCFFDSNMQTKMGEKRKKGYTEGNYQVWNAGLTKENDARVMISAKKISETHKKKIENGTYQSWQERQPTKWKNAIAKQSKVKRLSIEEIKLRISKIKGFSLKSKLDDVYSTRQYSLLVFECKKCKKEFSKTLKNFEDTPKCPICNPVTSYNQLEIYEFIKTICKDSEIILNDRSLIKPKEVDIYLPKEKFAIEFNGLSFHTENDLLNDYHWNKTKDCLSNDVKLIHIFSDEWRSEKQEIVKSMIRHRVNQTKQKIYARKCTIIKLKTSSRKAFLSTNHIDGDVGARESWGLTYNDKLVSVMSIRIPRQKKYGNVIEIARMATLLNTSVVGGFGKLFKHVRQYAIENKFEGILSYVDLRYGTGTTYEKAGFKEVGLTNLRFWWTNKSARFDRFKFRADAKRGLTQREVAKENKVYRIFCCPNKIMIYNL